jgi:flagellin
MSSIMTNVAAMTALQSLTATNQSLQDVQNQISTGYRVSSASDNAAYWSIATTMRSDNKAMSTVSDALGLGASQVNVAYTAMTQVQTTLDDIKTQLVTAKEPGVDKAKIQTQIAQDQASLQGFADSASFSGSNWLSVDSGSSGYSATQQVVSSFARGANGNINIGTINIDLGNTALFDASGKGLLEGSAGTGTASSTFSAGDIDAGGKINMAVDVGGTTQNVSVTVADPTSFTTQNLADGLNSSLQGATASVDSSGNLVITTNGLGASSTIANMTVSGLTKSDGTATTATLTLGTETDVDGTDSGNGVMGFDVTSASSGQVDTMINQLDAMQQNVTTAASNLGAVQSRITAQQSFVSSLMDSIDTGVGQLVDADMNKESTKLQALQVQQQLGVQALSIANSSSQSILSLFR